MKKRNLEEIQLIFPTTKVIKYSNNGFYDGGEKTTSLECSEIAEDNVIICLCDLIISRNDCTYQQLLTKKFNAQQKGKLLWLCNRESINPKSNYIPIEFSKDKYFVLKFLKNVKSRNVFVNSTIGMIDRKLLSDEDVLIELITAPRLLDDTEFNDIFVDLTFDNPQLVIKLLYLLKMEIKEELFCFWEKGINRNLFLNMVKQNGLILTKFPLFQSDMEIVREAIRQNGSVIDYLNSTIQNDQEIFLESLNRTTFGPGFLLPFQLSGDKDLVLKIVTQYGNALEQVSEDLKSDRDVVLASVRNNGCSLRYANKKFLQDEEIVREAIANSGITLKFLGENFKKDRNLVLNAVRTDSQAFLYMSQDLENDREIILEALKFPYPYVVEVASKSVLLQDRELVLQLVKYKGSLIELIPEQYMTDKEVVIQAIRSFVVNQIPILTYFSGNFQHYLLQHVSSDKSICLECLKKDISVLVQASGSTFEKEAMIEALKLYKKKALRYFHFMSLQNSVEFFSQAVKICGTILQYAPTKFKVNREIVLDAVQEDAESIIYSEIPIDRDLILEAVRKNGTVIRYIKQDYTYLIDGEILEIAACENPELVNQPPFTNQIDNFYQSVSLKTGFYAFPFTVIDKERRMEQRIDFAYFGAKISPEQKISDESNPMQF